MLLGLILLVLIMLLPFSLELRYNRLQTDSETVIVFWVWKLPLKLRVAYLEKLGSYLLTRANLQVSKAAAAIEPAIPLRRVFQLLRTPLPRLMKVLARVALFFWKKLKIWKSN